ncbi:MAG: DUF539 domain-containing protein [Methylohalobius sp.]|nr:DUF539 domain-containing protein [Methylohalobius sp.]
MTLFLITFAAIAVIFAFMAVGVMFGRPAIRGSCGGVGGRCWCAQGNKACDKGLPEEPR